MSGLIKLDREIREILSKAKQQRKERGIIMKLTNTLKPIWNWLQGKKTYLTSLIIAILAILEASGVPIAGWVYILLTAVLGVSVRSAISKVQQ